MTARTTLNGRYSRAIVATVSAFLLAAPMLGGQIHAAADAKDAKSSLDTSQIVSIGGDVTEILYALGRGDKIVAVDTTSQFPPSVLQEKKKVGYMRALSSEGVLALNPSTIIASASAGPAEVVQALKSSSVPYVEISDENSTDGINQKITSIAAAVSAESEGKALVARINEDFASLAKDREKVDKPMRVLFILSAQNGRALVGGSGTSADAIIKLAGGENAAASVTGFKPLVDEAIIELAPDVILMMLRGDGHDAHKDILDLKGVRATPAGKANRVIVMDGSYLLGFGLRTPAAARDLMTKLYDKAEGGTGSPRVQAN
ncbi:Periplasmic binding protein [Candidatus Filomicrobium marinum]|uniref:Periplasmic binding protein n=2 Tax=Filomicrobium TaxID=119044 RepID=A0A0D6JGB6_9HYPH|nr:MULTISPECIES: ABC transporter substrate-binding protein [Filomicrobium]MCV0370132.1 ABC transporter substrate-binding protein [Filomicrobium sp.]CFX25792.1 Periplasmic binding protein [Candidatus Filomicrobium marinum]CPR19350.1 Periplasmic binding protein [Candidatus Filomicrobium marinum]SDO08431.1 iron complex transport system substrate-binding protein [Filomicrobium insigne]